MDNQIQKYDRMYGGLIDVCISTKPSTVKVVQALTGRAETFIIQTEIGRASCRERVYVLV